MKEIQSFSQGQLIRQTGNIHPYGICLGLVTYWLIACHNHEESQYRQTLSTDALSSIYAKPLTNPYSKGVAIITAPKLRTSKY